MSQLLGRMGLIRFNKASSISLSSSVPCCCNTIPLTGLFIKKENKFISHSSEGWESNIVMVVSAKERCAALSHSNDGRL